MCDESPPRYFNIAPWFRKQYLEHGIKVEKQTSGQIAKILGRAQNLETLGLREHDALYDCSSILEGIKHFNGKDLFSNCSG